MAQTCHVLKYPTSISSNHVSYPIISYLLHRNCSEGTCDGCTFHFLWQSQHACPLCTTNHYREIISACIQGIQVLLHRHGHVGKNTFISSTSQNHRRQVHSSRAMATSSILFECFSNGIVSMISMQWSTRTSRHMFYNENLMFKKRTNMFVCVFQRTTYVWQQPLQCSGGVSLPAQKVSACVSLDFWLKFGVSTGTIAAVLLITISCYFWKKTRKWDT